MSDSLLPCMMGGVNQASGRRSLVIAQSPAKPYLFIYFYFFGRGGVIAQVSPVFLGFTALNTQLVCVALLTGEGVLWGK